MIPQDRTLLAGSFIIMKKAVVLYVDYIGIYGEITEADYCFGRHEGLWCWNKKQKAMIELTK